MTKPGELTLQQESRKLATSMNANNGYHVSQLQSVHLFGRGEWIRKLKRSAGLSEYIKCVMCDDLYICCKLYYL